MSYNLRSASVVSQEESDIEDDIVNVNDIAQSKNKCLQHNNVPRTQVCHYIGNYVNDFPVPPSVADQLNHDKTAITAMNNDAHTALRQLFPDMETSNTKFRLLSEFLQKFIDNAKLPLEQSERKKQSIDICSTIIHQYPNRGFCQLLTRWARKKKMDYPCSSSKIIL